MFLRAVILTTFFFCGSLALSAEISENSPRALVHLLDYLAQDYAGAVTGGKVISPSEYQEQNEFAEAAEKIGVELYKSKQPRLQGELNHIRDLIKSKASPQEVKSAALAAKAEVIKISGLPVAPSHWPSLKRGGEVFTRNCVQCHGVKGDGQGPLAKQLNPPPINFFNAQRMDGLAPFNIFNAIRVGVPGTGMAANHTLTDDDVWAVAFYVESLRHGAGALGDRANMKTEFAKLQSQFGLETIASQSDLQLREKIKEPQLAVLRVHSGEDENDDSLKLASALLDEALHDYKDGRFKEAEKKALTGYLEGVEPVEPRLRASDPALVSELESRMAYVRQVIGARKSAGELAAAIDSAKAQLVAASDLLNEGAPSPWLTFTIAAAILLREGFEAVLIVLALLGVVRAAGSKKAAAWVHGGWVVALGLGFAAWVFSGWLMGITGAQREMMEGVTSIIAVSVLLYMGFWLHRTTEIGRWTTFINGRVRTALQGSNLFGLAAISFMAVFREAFETVLFLRALWLEGGMAAKTALAAGVFGALGFILVASWIALKYTARIPIRKLFDLSSSLMAVLAVILIGKGIHSLQETGTLGVSASPLNFRIELIGLYPTYQTLIAQIVIFVAVLGLWLYGKKPSPGRVQSG